MRKQVCNLNKSIFAIVFLLLIVDPLKVKAIESVPFTVRKFISCIDGKEDCYAFISGKTVSKNSKLNQSDTLIVYLHGLSADFNEPFKLIGESSLALAIAQDFPTAPFVSFNYGNSPSWGNGPAKIDITDNLRSLIEELKIKKIIFIGNSMGATAALTYAATAPSYIKSLIAGIVAVCPCANLEDLYKQTNAPDVKTSLEGIFGVGAVEDPTVYQQNSFDNYVAFLPKRTKIGIISATADTIIPIGLQNDVIRDLNNREMTVKTIAIEGKVEPFPVKSVIELLHFVAG